MRKRENCVKIAGYVEEQGVSLYSDSFNRYCSISLTLPVDPRLFPLNKRGSNGRVKEIEQ